ncbi:MAG: hypothetical protein J4F50_02670 [Acidimicrobiia bacterium]|nr:hypothetical protein [Acidimicrobiia bacterium]
METVTLADLAPILAAVIGPMLLFAVAIMRYQHVDSTKTRDLIDEARRENRELIKEARKESRELIAGNRELIDRNRELIDRNRELIDGNHKELGGSLGDVRERLARIEGYLRIWPPPPHGANDGDAEAA